MVCNHINNCGDNSDEPTSCEYREYGESFAENISGKFFGGIFGGLAGFILLIIIVIVVVVIIAVCVLKKKCSLCRNRQRQNPPVVVIDVNEDDVPEPAEDISLITNKEINESNIGKSI